MVSQEVQIIIQFASFKYRLTLTLQRLWPAYCPCVWMMLISNTCPLIGINACNGLKFIFYNTRLKQVPTKEKIKPSTKTERVFYMKEFI